MLLWLASLPCGLVLRRGVELVQRALTAPVPAPGHVAPSVGAKATLPVLSPAIGARLSNELRVGPLLSLSFLHLLKRHW